MRWFAQRAGTPGVAQKEVGKIRQAAPVGRREFTPFGLPKQKHTHDRHFAGSENGCCSPPCHETSLAFEIIEESWAAVGEPGSVRLCPLLKIARKLFFTVRHRGMGTGISEASKRVPNFSFATQGGKQVSSHFRQGN